MAVELIIIAGCLLLVAVTAGGAVAIYEIDKLDKLEKRVEKLEEKAHAEKT